MLFRSVADFASNKLELKVDNRISAKALYQNYCLFCAENGRKPKNQTSFGRGLTHIFRNNNVSKVKSRAGVYLDGLGLV